MPLPQLQLGQAPQSAVVQVVQFSAALHTASPQVPAQLPQSASQLVQLSPGAQTPSPQRAHAPQSLGQSRQVSAIWQMPLPQASQSPQSRPHDAQDSVGPQVPSPQTSQAPQSAAQLAQVSLPAQAPSPHAVSQAPIAPVPRPNWIDTSRQMPLVHVAVPGSQAARQTPLAQTRRGPQSS